MVDVTRREDVSLTDDMLGTQMINRLKRLRWVMVLFLMLPWAGAEQTGLVPIFTSVDQVRRLPMEEAGKAYPVRLRGVITYRSKGRSLMFLQDASGGIYVHPDALPDEIKKLGSGVEIELEGVTGAGLFAPLVQGRNGRMVGKRALPEPAWLSADQLGDPRNHCQWVELGGLVRAVRVRTSESEVENEAVLSIGARVGRFTATLYGLEARNPALTNLVGALVRVRGVYGSIFNERRQLVGMRLFVSSTNEILVDRPAGGDPFVAAPRAVDTLMKYTSGPEEPTRVHIQGLVTLAVDDAVYMEDSSGGVKILPVAVPRVRAGEQISAVGFPAWGDCSPVLEDAEIRVVTNGPARAVPMITPTQAVSGDFEFRQVQMEALVVESPRHSQQSTFMLQAGETIFLAHCVGAGWDSGASIPEGSWVKLKGICVNQVRPEAGDIIANSSTNMLRRPLVFHLLLGSPGDVMLVRAPSWWTTSRLVGALVLLGGVLLGAMLWVTLLRRKVEEASRTIRSQAAREAVHEERERIARELHDTLEQEITGVAMHLDAASAMIGPNQQAAVSAIETARGLLDRSRLEARQSIWELRSPALEQGGLAAALEEIAAAERAPGAPVIRVKVQGTPRRFPLKTEAHLLRIAHEAVTNAIKHSGAAEVTVCAEFDSEGVRLTISDEGRGFDPGKPIGRMHYGLMGMRERAGRIHGILKIESAPGKGTQVSISARQNLGS